MPPPPASLFAQMGMARGGEFGSAIHLAHVTKLQLDYGENGGNNIRIPLTLGSDDEEPDDDDEDDDIAQDGRMAGARGGPIARGARLPPAGKAGQITKGPARAAITGTTDSARAPKKPKAVTMNVKR